MENILLIIIAVLIVVILLLYNRFKNTGLYDEIKTLEAKKDELTQEIEIKKYELQSIDRQINPSNELNYKLDILINNRNKDNTIIIAILIAIGTAVTIFCIYKYTYYIQPDNLIKSINNSLNGYLQ